MNETSAPLLVERSGPILIARMNRPERMNALGDGMSEAMNAAWFELRDDPTLKVMILTGVGERAFCVGADLRQSTERFQAVGARTAQEVLDADRAPVIRAAFTANNFGLYKPVIAAINGWCLAGGCEIALGCDIRIMESHALMGLPEVKRGMAAKTTTHKIHFLTYLSLGLEVEWTGDPLTASRAKAAGLVNEVVPTGDSLDRAKEIAHVIAQAPVSYLHYHKERMFQSIGLPLQYALSTRERVAAQLQGDLDALGTTEVQP